ncbi:MAG: hypothetical protein PUC98_07225 [Clostridiales bacterium]|nr:hypothetical protein [Clostridiales bacterium]
MNELYAVIDSLDEQMKRYDREVKQLFVNRRVLAIILKRFVPEYEGCELEEIMDTYIEPELPDAASVNVQKNRSNITGMSNEDNANNERDLRYDIRFRAAYPGGEGKYIGLIINLELQGRAHMDYPLEMRAVYYSARNISSQLTDLSESTDYGTLQKVYSIWIIYDDRISREDAGTVSLYSFNKNDIIGHMKVEKQHYDLISIIMIKLKESVENDDPCLKLINVLTSSNMSREERKAFLDRAGFDDEYQEEVSKVVEYGFGRAAYDHGIERGMAEGEAKAIRDVAFRLFRNGTDYQTVIVATGMPYETIDAWHKEYVKELNNTTKTQ